MLDRFWAKVDIRGDDECWPWRSEADTYGRFRITPTGGAIGAHRLSWILANGEDIPPWVLVMHSCDNKRCVNPGHLSAGSCSENTKDAVDKGLIDMTKAWAGIKKRDRCTQGHELTAENVYESGGRRKCKPCFKKRQLKYRDRYNDQRRERRARRREEMKANGNQNGHDREWRN